MPRYPTTKVAALPAARGVAAACLLALMCGGSSGAWAAEAQEVIGGAPPPVADQATASPNAPAGPDGGGARPAAADAVPAPAGALPATSLAGDPSLVVDGDISAMPPSAAPHRPRFSMGVGMGVSFDSTGFVDARTVAVPAFQVQLGVGEELLGFELRLFSTQASGRYHRRAASLTMLAQVDTPADRLAIDVLLALRPFAATTAGDPRWWIRVVKSVTVNVGGAGENATTGTPAVIRFGAVVGFHVDLPLLPATAASGLGLRITGRRMLARQANAGMTAVSDTTGELFGGLALSF